MMNAWIMINMMLVITVTCANSDIIRILSGRRMNAGSCFIQSEKFYRKFQEPAVFTIHGASNLYSKVTGFTMAFHHTVPLLYKINFDAISYNPNAATWIFPRIMVNDYLVYNDRFLKNTEDRYKSISGYDGVHMFDHIGTGQYAFFTTIATAIKKSELIYLRPGLNVIDVAVRAIGAMPVLIYYGVLTVELVEFNDGANLGGIWPMNISSIN